MERFIQLGITFGGWAVGLILLFQLVTHPDAVVSEFKAVSGFTVEESKVLEGR